MIASIRAALAEKRAFKHEVPFTEAELAQFHEAPVEGRSIRRHRRRNRLRLMKQAGS